MTKMNETVICKKLQRKEKRKQMSGHFTTEDQEKIREQLFTAGITLLKEYGVQRMTVDKLARAVGIAKGSFYNFYSSKEDFLIALFAYTGEKSGESLQAKMGGRQQISTHEFIEYYKEYLKSDYDLMQFVSAEDFMWMQKHMAVEGLFDAKAQEIKVRGWLSMLTDAGSHVNPGVVVNLLKCIYAMREHRKNLVESALDESIEYQLKAVEHYIKGN